MNNVLNVVCVAPEIVLSPGLAIDVISYSVLNEFLGFEVFGLLTGGQYAPEKSTEGGHLPECQVLLPVEICYFEGVMMIR